MSSKLISNTFYLLLDWGFATILSLLYWIVIGKALLPYEYGIVTTSTSFMLIFSGITLLGLNTALQKLIPEYLEKKKRVKNLIKFSLKITMISNTIFILIVILSSSLLSPIFKVPDYVLIMSALGTLAISLSYIFGSVIYGFQDMKKYFTTDFLCHLTKIIFTPILLLLGLKFYGPIISFILAFVVLAVFRFDLSWIKKGSDKIDKKEVIFNYSIPAFVAYISMLLFSAFQYMVLPILQNQEVAGLFAVAMRATSLVIVLPSILSSALFPIISQLSANFGMKNQQSRLLNLTLRYTILLLFPLAVFIAYFSKPLILIFARPEFLPAFSLFPILTLASLIYGIGSIFLSSLYAIKQPKLNRDISLVSAIVFLVLSFLLSYFYSSFGLASAYLISSTLLAFLSFFSIRKYLLIRLSFKTFSKILVSTLIFSLLLYLTDVLQVDLIYKLIIFFVSGIVYFLVLLPLKFYIKEDEKILQFMAERIPFLRKFLLDLSNFLSKYIEKN